MPPRPHVAPVGRPRSAAPGRGAPRAPLGRVIRHAGAGLLEVLVALLVLSLGLMGAARLQAALQLGSDVARQRDTAVRLAQLDLEAQRALASVAAAPGLAAYEQLADASTRVEGDNTVYTVQRRVRDDPAAVLKFSSVEVHWTDRTGAVQQVELHSGISGSLPGATGALAVAAPGNALGQALGRHPGIPRLAQDLGDGRSVWQLAGGERQPAYVFDNRSGEVQARCRRSGPAPSRPPTSTDLASCESFRAALLQGHVRFDLGSAPDPDRPPDTPLPLAVALWLDPPPATAPHCEVHQGIPSLPASAPLPTGSSARLASASASASGTYSPGTAPASAGTQAKHEAAAAYTCVVPLPEGGWSGVFRLVPRGWTLGHGPSQYRVCRYSTDLDRSGRIDRNDEHPAQYSRVNQSMAEQNYLVIRGELSCPRRTSAPHNGGFADTLPHQP